MKLYHDPSLDHLDAKIYAWIIGCILTGITLAIVFPDFDQDMINRTRRPTRTVNNRCRAIGRTRAVRRREVAYK